MLSSNSLDFPYQHENKDLSLATKIHEDPFTDLFDQYISQDSSTSSGDVNATVDFGGFDFGFCEQAKSSSSYVAAQPLSGLAYPRARRLHSSSYDTFSATCTSKVLPPQRHHKSLYFDKPTEAISSVELLSLEGKLPYEAFANQKTSLTSVPALPLRRKAKFNPETLRGQANRISKPAGISTAESPNMVRPPCYYRRETPSYQEWTRRFEQISLQAPTGNLPLSPPASATFETKATFSSRKPQHHVRQESFDQSSITAQGFGAARHTIPSPLASPISFDPQHPSEHLDNSQLTLSNLHSPSWAHPTTNAGDFDFAISPQDVEPNWSQDVLDRPGAYYDNTSAAQPPPALSEPEPEYPHHGLILDPYDHFVAEDPSVDYFATPMGSFQLTANDAHTPPLPQEESNQRACTPSSRASSRCPSPPPPSVKSPSKPRQRSKGHRRSKTSISGLKSKSSAGTMGFVNFTPSDSQKILTAVAPSGSSKTKARRELEAHEKKRKLSLAVEKVVRDAGGDSAKLKLVGLL